MLVKEAFDKFIYDKKVSNLTEASIQSYKGILNLFIRYIGEYTNIQDINDIKIVKQYIMYLRDKKLSTRTIHTYLKNIKVFYRYLMKENIIKYNNDIDKISVKFDKKYPDILEIEELEIIISKCDIRERIIVLLVLDNGVRKKELIEIKKDDVRKTGIHIDKGKGRKTRKVPISKELYYMIEEYKKTLSNNSEYLIQNKKTGEKLKLSGIRAVIRRLRDKVGIDRLGLHLLRHTYATHYINNGGDIKTLQLIMGHHDTTITEVYIHLSNMLDIQRYSKYSVTSRILKSDA